MKENQDLLKKARQFTKERKYNKAQSCYALFKILYPELADIVIVNETFLRKRVTAIDEDSALIMEVPVFDNFDYLIKKFWEVLLSSPYDVKIDVISGTAEHSFLLAWFNSSDILPDCNHNKQNILVSFFENTPFFDCDFYKNQYKVVSKSEDSLSHYIQTGFAEEKLPARWFDVHVGKNTKINTIMKLQKESTVARQISGPQISVLVPVFNNAEYLHECINSIINQTLHDIEVIIIDDGSTDKQAVAIMDDFAKKDNRIRLIHKKNTGYGHTLNCGLLSAKGEYIGIVESDDYIISSMYEKMLSIAKKYNVYFVKCNSMRFYGEGKNRTFEKLVTVKSKAHYNTILNTHKDPLLLKMYNTNTNGIFQRKFLYDNNIKFNETPGASFQDNGFWFQTFLFATKFYCISDFFYMIRRDNPNSSVFSKEKVYCICDEYSFIQNILSKDKNLEKLFIKMYYWKKYGNYLFSLKRVDEKYKESFLEIFASEFNDAYLRGYLDKGVFAEHWDNLMNIISRKNSKKESKEKVNICYISDEKYIIPTATSLVSLLDNTSDKSEYCIWLLHTNFSKSSIENFLALQRKNVEIKIINATRFLDKLPKHHLITNKNVTNTALMKFYIPEIIPEVDKILYIDGDTLIITDLSELFAIPLADNLCCAVQDSPWGLYAKKKIKEIYFSHFYFNSGVLLLNAKKIREMKISDSLIKCKEWLTTSLMDQDAFNYVMYGKINFLPLQYNVMIDAIYRHMLKGKITLDEINKKTKSNYTCFDDILKTAKIIHFGSYYKPWKYYDLICAELWFQYFLRTPFVAEGLERKSRLSEYISKNS